MGPEVVVSQQIAEIDQKINEIISNIEYQIAEDLTDSEGDDYYFNLMVAKEDWPERINFPPSKGVAIRILENPQSSKLDKLAASLFAEMWKKYQIKKAHRLLENTENGWLVLGLDDD